MADNNSKPVGCSRCLIVAIERGDEATLRRLLSVPDISYCDCCWVPRSSLFTFIAPYPKCCNCFPVVSAPQLVVPRFNRLPKQCNHLMIDADDKKSLIPGHPCHICMSVVLTSMLYTTTQFNALQILVESQQFDLSEPLIFHWRYGESDWKWNLVAVDAIGMAILLDKGSDIEDQTSFLLLKTLQKYSFLKMKTELRLMVLSIGYDRYGEEAFENDFDACRASDILSFLVSCYEIDFSRTILGCNKVPSNLQKCIFTKIRALCDMGVVCLESDTLTCYFKKSRNVDTNRIISRYISSTLFNALARLFDIRYYFGARCESFVSESISNGWIWAIRGEQGLYRLVCALHNDYESNRSAAFRIARQLLALGFFREPLGNAKLQWPHPCFYIKEITGQIRCEICSIGHKPEMTLEECPLVAPLMNEFFRQPLSLQQLSRIQIRHLIGMKDFERQVKCLSLPPSVITYVWRANEMLADVKLFEDEVSSDSEKQS